MCRSLYVVRSVVLVLCILIVSMFEAPKPFSAVGLAQAAGTPSPVFLPIVAVTTTNDSVVQIAFSDPDHGWMTLGVDLREGMRKPSETMSLLATADGGETWTTLPEPTTPMYGLTFVSPTKGWALTRYEMLTTNDGGMSWTHVTLPKNTKVYSVQFFDVDKGMLSTDNGWLETNDGGQTWTATTVSDPCSDWWESHLALASRKLGWRLCGSEGAAGFQAKELYRTTDGGVTWQFIGKSTFGEPFTGEPGTLSSFGYTWDIEFIDALYGWMYLARGGISTTSDGGRSWQDGGDFDGQLLSSITPLTASDGFLVVEAQSYRSKVMRTRDGGETWQQVYPRVSP